MQEKEFDAKIIKADTQSGSSSFKDNIRATISSSDLIGQNANERILCNNEEIHQRTLNEDVNRHLTYTKDDDTE